MKIETRQQQEMELFSGEPRCFKIERKSVVASKLKGSIADKLLQFIPNLTDHVLAEYIVVLVCNGKHQYQAREDLEAFLGDSSGDFVSWLWGLLMRTADQSHLSIGSSNIKDVKSFDDHMKNSHTTFMPTDLLNSVADGSNMLFEDEFCPMTIAPKPVSSADLQASEDLQCSLPGCHASRDRISGREARTRADNIPPKSRSADDKCCEVFKHKLSRTEPREFSANGDHNVLLDKHKMHKKMVNHFDDRLLGRFPYPPNRDPPPTSAESLRRDNPTSRLFTVNDASATRFHSRDFVSASSQNARPRGNVWDRLGRPCEENNNARSKKVQVHGSDVVENEILEHHVEGLEQSRSMLSGRRYSSSIKEGPVFDNNCNPIDSETNHNVRRLNVGRKRQFSDSGPGCHHASAASGDGRDRHLQDKGTLEQSIKPSSAKCGHSQSLRAVSFETRNVGGMQTDQTYRSPANVTSLIANKVSTEQSAREFEASRTGAVVSSALVTKPHLAVGREDGVNSNFKPVQAEVLDMKIKLHQIEMEMSKLQSKKLESNNGKSHSSSSCGKVNDTEEDVDSRTVFVTNVHFAATKEALSLHFAKYGEVARVVILNDAVTAQPKGAAYVIFNDKESADKAVASSGISFWSRALKVVRKAEMSVDASSPTLLSGKPSWQQFHQPNKRVFFQGPNFSTNLQWRRDQQNASNNSLSAV